MPKQRIGLGSDNTNDLEIRWQRNKSMGDHGVVVRFNGNEIHKIATLHELRENDGELPKVKVPLPTGQTVGIAFKDKKITAELDGWPLIESKSLSSLDQLRYVSQLLWVLGLIAFLQGIVLFIFYIESFRIDALGRFAWGFQEQGNAQRAGLVLATLGVAFFLSGLWAKRKSITALILCVFLGVGEFLTYWSFNLQMNWTSALWLFVLAYCLYEGVKAIRSIPQEVWPR